VQEHQNRQENVTGKGSTTQKATSRRAASCWRSWWLDWTAGLFPVILAVFVLRSFI
jgi:signal peptidase I